MRYSYDWTNDVMRGVESYRVGIEEEFGPFTMKPAFADDDDRRGDPKTCWVILCDDDEKGEAFTVAYLASHYADANIVIDDDAMTEILMGTVEGVTI